MADPNNRYDLTAARSHEILGTRPWRDGNLKSLTVDIHAHGLVTAAAALARPHLAPDPRAALYAEETRILGRMQDADRTPNLVDLDLRMSLFSNIVLSGGSTLCKGTSFLLSLTLDYTQGYYRIW